MKQLLIATVLAAILGFAIAPAFSAPGEHDLKSGEGVKKFFEEQSDRGN
jgi:hypothetical protein